MLRYLHTRSLQSALSWLPTVKQRLPALVINHVVSAAPVARGTIFSVRLGAERASVCRGQNVYLCRISSGRLQTQHNAILIGPLEATHTHSLCSLPPEWNLGRTAGNAFQYMVVFFHVFFNHCSELSKDCSFPQMLLDFGHYLHQRICSLFHELMCSFFSLSILICTSLFCQPFLCNNVITIFPKIKKWLNKGKAFHDCQLNLKD